MKMLETLTAAVVAVALTFTAVPVAAQGRSREDRGRPAREAGQAAPRDAGRQATPRQDGRSVAPRDYGRAQAAPRYNAPRQEYRNEPRRDGGRVYVAPRRDDRRVYVAPRGYVAPRAYTVPRHRYDATPYYRYYRAPYRPYYFGRPYYVFRPRVNIGFGLWIGFGVPYPRAWVTYAPPVYGYYQGAVRIVPGVTNYGGVSFDISPRDAAIILDGTFIGYAGDFLPTAAPLTLTPGAHRIEVQADGYQPMLWDVDIIPGQVIPFRGDMQPY